MELRHLRYFCATAREMHVGRAAETLHIAQPALTIQIKALEAEIGTKLFDRVGRSIVLTEAGQAFLHEATAILENVERATAIARDIGKGVAGTLRVGFTESASFSPIVNQVLTAFRLDWPDVELLLEEDITEALVQAMERGSLDVAFVRPPTRASEALTVEPMGNEPMVVAMAKQHRLARRKSVKLRELASEDFVSRKRNTALSDAVMAACRRAGFAPRIAQHAPQLSAMINLVSASLGIAIVPSCMREVRKDSVAFVSIDDLDVHAQLGLLRHHRNRPAAQNFIQAALSLRRRHQ